jgi:hypothetical protein
MANHWYFGNTFNTNYVFVNGNPTSNSPVGFLNSFEGSTSLAGPNGDLLFYTNGGGRPAAANGPEYEGMIWNRDHDTLQNGYLGYLRGGRHSAEQPAVAIPAPGGNYRYYWVFTMEEIEYTVSLNLMPSADSLYLASTGGTGLSAILIDMAQDSGRGGVVDEFPKLLTPAYEHQAVVRHTNGQDYWICAYDTNGTVHAFPVTASGIGTAVQSGSGVGGALTFSPNGQWLCIGETIYSFNATTGQLSTGLVTIPNAWRCSFSPNSNLFYIANDDTLWQYNLQASNILASGVVISPTAGVGRLQLGPDRKLYIAPGFSFGGCDLTVGVVNCPNNLGVACSLGTATPMADCGTDFGGPYWPQFDNGLFADNGTCPPPYSPPAAYANAGPDTSICAGQPLLLYTPGVPAGGTILWSTGATTQTIVVTQPGTYTVTVSVPGGGTDTDTVVVGSGGALNVNLGPDVTACASGVALSPGSNPGATFLWSTGSTDSTLVAGVSGTYWVTVNSGGCIGTDTVNVTLTAASFSVNLGPDTTTCAGQPVVLDPTVTGLATGTYVWNNGTTDTTLAANTSGLFWVTVSNAGCSSSDTVNVLVLGPPVAGFNIDTTNCPTLFFNAQEGFGSQYIWNFGTGVPDTTTTDTVSFTYPGNGNYAVSLTVIGQCGTNSLTIPVSLNCVTSVSEALQAELALWPNPAHGTLNIGTGTLNGTLHLQLVNTTGQVVLRHTAHRSGTAEPLTLPLTGLASGVYTLVAAHGDGQAAFRVVVK